MLSLERRKPFLSFFSFFPISNCRRNRSLGVSYFLSNIVFREFHISSSFFKQIRQVLSFVSLTLSTYNLFSICIPIFSSLLPLPIRDKYFQLKTHFNAQKCLSFRGQTVCIENDDAQYDYLLKLLYHMIYCKHYCDTRKKYAFLEYYL